MTTVDLVLITRERATRLNLNLILAVLLILYYYLNKWNEEFKPTLAAKKFRSRNIIRKDGGQRFPSTAIFYV
jgi:hypothetical protein